jgi:glycosyl transferase family 2
MSDITAIIPTYNRAGLLSRAIESILKQTVQPDQVIVVDDGSTDETSEVCGWYAGRVEYVRQENQGASAARNVGLEHARHRWIAFLDSDDYWTEQHLERLTAAIHSTRAEADVYFSDMEMPEEEGGGTLWQRIGFQPMTPVHLLRDATPWALMKRQPMMLQTTLIDISALERMGGFDVRYRLSHDTHCFCELTIGRAACAVAGVGCVQTADDTSPVRLSTEIPLDSVGKAHESCSIWCEVLRNGHSLSPAFRRLVQYNAAGSHWQVGMSLVKSGDYPRGLAKLLRASVIDPRFALWVAHHGTARGYEEKVRPSCAEVNTSRFPADLTQSEGRCETRWWKGSSAL